MSDGLYVLFSFTLLALYIVLSAELGWIKAFVLIITGGIFVIFSFTVIERVFKNDK